MNDGVVEYQPPEPFGAAGVTAIEVDGLTLSSLIVRPTSHASVFPALSTDQ